ncbi:response regulator transcription factor [Pseudolysinimonas sp.]|uniref:response regulator transcription factor n=1 Tax=Pseudolysinimonas sp. TaxID=2680009 RepID=UPI003F8186F1
MTRVVLIDDHELVALAVQEAVARVEGVEFLGSAPTVADVLAAHPEFEVAILDLRLADGSSPVANVERLDAQGARVLVLTSAESPYLVRSVSKAPIAGLLRKSEPVASLAEAIRRVAAGEDSMSADWAAAIDGDPQLADAGLSPQEQAVLGLFARGLKAQAVAAQMHIAVGTVDDYVRRIRAKYVRAGRPAATKVDLYQRAVEDGILPAPDAER